MKAVWNGAISFGLVNIPVDLISAESSSDIKFNLLDSRDESRIRYERINEETGEEVPWNKIVKAYEFSEDKYVIVTDEDFEKADLKASKTIDIEAFIEDDTLDYMYLDKPYFIRPRKGGEKAYVLLRKALEETKKVAISRVVIRTRAYLAAIYANKDALILDLMRFDQELKKASDIGLPKEVNIKDQELELAKSLIDSMTKEWKPSEYKDEYRMKLMDRIKAKAKGIEDEETESDDEEENSDVIDIMDLLKKSVSSGKNKKAAGAEELSEKDEKKSKTESRKKAKTTKSATKKVK